MAHLTNANVYNIEDSNIALLGSDLEKHIREHAGDQEPAWQSAGKSEGIEIWRIEKFQVKPWPVERYGSFYDGDSYIVLKTYKKSPDAKSFSYNLHFWLGTNTTQDEAGTAAYKTVELDDLLHDIPVQWREAQHHESHTFLSYFPRFLCLQGGISTGFHHVSHPPPDNVKKLYRIRGQGSTTSGLVVHEVPASAESLVDGDVYVLDKGVDILQFNTKKSIGKEKFKAAEFVQSIVNERHGPTQVAVYDEGDSGASKFLNEFGQNIHLRKPEDSDPPTTKDLAKAHPHPTLYRISDAAGQLTFEIVPKNPPTRASLSSDDAFLLDPSSSASHPAIFIWIGKNASLNEKRMALQYAQRYLHDKQINDNNVRVMIPIVKMVEGEESADFLDLL